MTKKEILEIARETLGFSDNLLDVVGGIIITAKQPNGLYTVFLPYYNYNNIYFDRLYCVCHDVEEILYNEGNSKALILMKVRTGENIGYWTMLYPHAFAGYLTDERCKGRFKTLPKIPFQEKTTAKFLTEFKLWNSSMVIQIDGINYLVGKINFDVYSEETGVVIRRIDGKIQPFPCEDELKIIDENGNESICSVYNLTENKPAVTFGPAFSIEEIDKDFYPVINDNYTVHIAKDSQRNMMGVYIAQKRASFNFSYSYKIKLLNPAKIKFVGRIILQEGLNGKPNPDKAADLWQIFYLDGKSEIFVQIIGLNEYFKQFKITCTS